MGCIKPAEEKSCGDGGGIAGVTEQHPAPGPLPVLGQAFGFALSFSQAEW